MVIGLVVLAVIGLVVALSLERVVIYEYERGVLYRRGRRVETLTAGTHWIRRGISSVTVLDVRSRVTVVPNQEILTADGVPLRASVTLCYRVARPEVAVEAAAAFTETLHAQTQLVLRDLVGAMSAEQVLPQRPRLAEGLQAALAPRAAALGLELEEAGVRDVAFPSPMKQMFAQVAEARQAALAALEKARGETAVLRHLANTAQLLEEHPALATLRALDTAAQSRGTFVMGVPPAVLPLSDGGGRRPHRSETTGTDLDQERGS
jgi:regulator of protease activity HflC (stomatin/prohibitin superfamily)